MAEDRGTLRAVDWHELFPGLMLLSAVRPAFAFRSLLLAAVAVIGTSAGWRICGELFSRAADEPMKVQMAANGTWPWEWSPAAAPLGWSREVPAGDTQTLPSASTDPAGTTDQVEPPSSPDQVAPVDAWRADSPLVRGRRAVTAPFEQLFAVQASFTQFVYWLCCALWSLAVWAFFGGAITRIAALRIARQENVSWGQLSQFVRPRWPSYFAAPFFPILGAFLLAAMLALLGVLMRSGPGLLLAGIVWPVVLVAGFMMAFLLIGLFFAWPLMWGAVSAEGTDSFGALSHSYSYVYQRPLHYLFYAVIAALIGVLGWYLVSLFALWTLALADWGISWGSGAATLEAIARKDAQGMLGNPGAALIRFWTGCVRMVPLAYVFSYLWTASTAIYFLLRRHVDATEIDAVYSPDERDRHGLPPLKTGPDGVPQVADDPVLAGDDAS